MSNPIKKISKVELWGVLSRADELISLATDKTTGKINPVVDEDSLRELSETLDKVIGQSVKDRWDDSSYCGTIEGVPRRYVPKHLIKKDPNGGFKLHIGKGF